MALASTSLVTGAWAGWQGRGRLWVLESQLCCWRVSSSHSLPEGCKHETGTSSGCAHCDSRETGPGLHVLRIPPPTPMGHAPPRSQDLRPGRVYLQGG